MANGTFSANPKTEWLTEVGADRNMRLLEDFWYDDPNGRRWAAPKGSVVNGASIPEALWSSVGSPYTGDYRRASIVHDVACDTPGVSREDADDMFYWACLTGGCSAAQAKVFYLGVRIGSWASGSGLFALAEIAPKPRLAIEHSRAELVLQAKYTLVADVLASTPDDFATVKAVIDQELDH
jgi:hypothetical protein